MDKRIYICAAIVLLFALLALIAYNNFEIYQEKVPASPVREVYINPYYALEQWLNKTGHPVRIEKGWRSAEITGIPENVAVVHATAYNYSWANAEELILPWIEKGNSLLICLDYYDLEDIDENLLEFLSGLGIEKVEITNFSNDFKEENIPDFSWYFHFLINEDADIFTVRDNKGYARLAELSLGEGKLVITGFPLFMYNVYLKNEINAAIAWKLTGARATGGNMGVLFIQERQIAKSIFGKIMERGNLLPVIFSVLFVIILGFWMVIPVFGIVLEEKQKNSRSIRERFAAEISFLKKYKALDYYLDIYKREHKFAEQTRANVSDAKEKYNYREIINKLRSEINGKQL
jgi:hypothetical protein